MTAEEKQVLKEAIRQAGLGELTDEDLEEVTGGACGAACKVSCLACATGGVNP